MLKIIIWGLGSGAKKVLDKINLNKVQIIGFMDSENENINKEVFGKYIKLDINKLCEIEFDTILVASEYTIEIYDKIKKIGITDEKITFVYGNNPIENKWEKKNQNSLETLLKRYNGDYKKIALVTVTKSGCNCRALFQHIPDYIKNKYEVALFEETELTEIEGYGTVISTHFNGIYDGRINIDLWHGFGVKAAGIFSNQRRHLVEKTKKRLADKIDLFITYSKLSQLSMVGMFGANPLKFKIVGEPRTDFLYKKRSFTEILDIDKNKKIILYMPTFRDTNRRKIIDLKEIEVLKLKLEEKNAVLIIKDHIYSMDSYEWADNKVIYDLSKYEFENDFYEYLGSVDCLITDYSSIYFDFLLLNKQMIFLISDMEKYEEERGLLLEPYDFWAPGHKVTTWIEAAEFFGCEKEDEAYRRASLRKLIHKFSDNQACNRVWKEIDEFIESEAEQRYTGIGLVKER